MRRLYVYVCVRVYINHGPRLGTLILRILYSSKVSTTPHRRPLYEAAKTISARRQLQYVLHTLHSSMPGSAAEDGIADKKGDSSDASFFEPDEEELEEERECILPTEKAQSSRCTLGPILQQHGTTMLRGPPVFFPVQTYGGASKLGWNVFRIVYPHHQWCSSCTCGQGSS